MGKMLPEKADLRVPIGIQVVAVAGFLTLSGWAILELPAFIVSNDAGGTSQVASPMPIPTPTLNGPSTASMATPSPSVSSVPPSTVAPIQSSPAQLTEARASALTGARQAVLLTIGGLVALVTLWLSYARHRRERESAELDKDSNRTDRYTQAIEQLGSDKPSIVLGGIYALERLARDSLSDRQTVANVLAGYLRDTSPTSEQDGPLSTVAAAAVSVVAQMQGWGTALHLDLTGVNMSGAQIPGARFEGAMLNAAHLDGADLVGATFTGAHLKNAHLKGAFLKGALLDQAILIEAHLNGARAPGANFANSNLHKAGLNKAVLAGAILDGADLSGARMQGSSLKGARLIGTILKGADFNLTDLSGVSFEGALVAGAKLNGATGYTPPL